MTITEGKCRLYGSGVHCRTCLTDEKWRSGRGIDACPHGVTLDALPKPVIGPGTALKAILLSMGIKAGKCSCNAMATKMDRWGPSGCREHLPEIVASLVKEANRRKWMKVIPMKGLWAEMLVNQAIEASEKPTS